MGTTGAVLCPTIDGLMMHLVGINGVMSWPYRHTPQVTIKAHVSSTHPPSPLQNREFGLMTVLRCRCSVSKFKVEAHKSCDEKVCDGFVLL